MRLCLTSVKYTLLATLHRSTFSDTVTLSGWKAYRLRMAACLNLRNLPQVEPFVKPARLLLPQLKITLEQPIQTIL